MKKRPTYIKYIKEIDYLKSEIDYREGKFNDIMQDFMGGVDEYAALNLPDEYNIKKQEEQAKSDADGTSEIDDETIERHINENERIEEEKAKAKLEAQQNPLPAKFKKLYKKIVLKTHPDKLIGADDEEIEEMTQYYKSATQAYDTVDPIDLIYIAYDLSISVPELDDEELSLFDIKINKLKGEVQHYETTYPWVWYHENNSERKEFILKNYVEKNF